MKLSEKTWITSNIMQFPVPKVLIIRFSSIGDIVLASPVFRCVKTQLPNAEVHFVTKWRFRPVTVANPYIDKFYYLQNDLSHLIELLKSEKYDYVIDLHNNMRSWRIKNALNVRSYTIDKLNIQKFLLTELNIDLMPGIHITTRSLNTVKPLKVQDDGLGLDYFIPEKDKVAEKDLPTSHLAGYIGIVIGANYFTKKLPVAKLQELCFKIEHPIILIGGPEDKKAGDEIVFVDPFKIYNASGKFNLNESADLVKRAKLIISHDTGFQYIACAFQKQVIAIWGGTSPRLDVEPYYGSKYIALQKEPVYENIFLDLSCQPCSKFGTRKCPLEHFNCMWKQDIDHIVQRVHYRLGIAAM